MKFSGNAYALWTHETAVVRVEGKEDDRERAELVEIWALGVGGELCELLAEVEHWHRPLEVSTEARTAILTETGDLVYYLARLYVDSWNIQPNFLERLLPRHGKTESFTPIFRHVGGVVECVKKALRAHGRTGVNALCTSEGDFADEECKHRGRRAEFGRLLDEALNAVETWLVANDSSLEEVCELNKAKLLRRRAEGTIASQKRAGKQVEK